MSSGQTDTKGCILIHLIQARMANVPLEKEILKFLPSIFQMICNCTDSIVQHYLVNVCLYTETKTNCSTLGHHVRLLAINATHPFHLFKVYIHTKAAYAVTSCATWPSENHKDSTQTALYALLSSSFLIWLGVMELSVSLTKRSDSISHRFAYLCSLQKT